MTAFLRLNDLVVTQKDKKQFYQATVMVLAPKHPVPQMTIQIAQPSESHEPMTENRLLQMVWETLAALKAPAAEPSADR